MEQIKSNMDMDIARASDSKKDSLLQIPSNTNQIPDE